MFHVRYLVVEFATKTVNNSIGSASMPALQEKQRPRISNPHDGKSIIYRIPPGYIPATQ